MFPCLSGIDDLPVQQEKENEKKQVRKAQQWEHEVFASGLDQDNLSPL